MRAAVFHELFDFQHGLPARTPGRPTLVHSRLRRGSGLSQPSEGLSVKYVFRGAEHYRFAQHRLTLRPGQMLVTSSALENEVRIAPDEDSVTVGLCLFLPPMTGAGDVFGDLPFVLPTDAVPLGRRLAELARLFETSPAQRRPPVHELLGGMRLQIDECAAQIGAAMNAMGAVKPATRRVQYQRLERARTLLHDTPGRSVELAELAAAAGISPFQCARNFKLAFGAAPSTYHRRLRLQMAREALRTGAGNCLDVAHRFGFADASSFSRAFRREFGCAPTAVAARGKPGEYSG